MDEEAAFDLLMGTCPSLLGDDELRGFVASFEDDGAPDRFVRLAALSHHVVALVASRRTSEAGDVLGVAEQVLVEGDGDAVELVRMGLLEPLQNITSHDDVLVAPEQVVPLLGPAGRAVWEELDELWGAAGSWGSDARRVTVADYDRVLDPHLRRYLQASKRRCGDGSLVGTTDVVRYQQMVADLSPVLPAGRARIPANAVAVGLLLAAVLLVLVVR